MSDYQELLRKAKLGDLSKREISAVAAELKKSDPAADRYTLLHILGRSSDRSHRQLVEDFLSCEDDPMLARLALQILCNYWDDANRYVEEIRRFVRGVGWDQQDDVRLVAISAAGEYLRSHADPAVLAELIRMFKDQDERQITREATYAALGRAMGLEWDQLPPAARHFDLERDVNRMVVVRAEERLSREGR